MRAADRPYSRWRHIAHRLFRPGGFHGGTGRAGRPFGPPNEGLFEVTISHPNPSGHGGCDCLPRRTAEDRGAEDRGADPAPRASAAIPFVLRYEDRWFGLEKRVTFAAPDVAAALAMMELEPIGRWAELSQGGAVICRRGGEPGGAVDYWVAD